MNKSLNEVKRNGLRKQLDVLLKQLENLYSKLSFDQSGSGGVSIEAEIESLEDKAEKILEKITELDQKIALQPSIILPDANKTEQQRQVARVSEEIWEQDLHKIDYKESKKRVIPILESLSEDAGEAFLLLHNADSFKGSLCVRFIDREFSERCGSNLYRLEISLDSDLSSKGFSHKLAERLNLRDLIPEQYLEQGLTQLSSALSESAGCFVELNILRKIDDKNELLSWLLQDFRAKLMQCLNTVRQTQPYFSLVFVISIRGSLPITLEGAVCCDQVDMATGGFLKLPLENWEKADITRWMSQFSGLPLRYSDCVEIAETLYDSFEGNPANTYRGLAEERQRLSRSIGLSQSLAS
jgi:hypothetical protein